MTKKKGWVKEPARHSLAAKGVKTGARKLTNPQHIPAKQDTKVYDWISRAVAKKEYNGILFKSLPGPGDPPANLHNLKLLFIQMDGVYLQVFVGGMYGNNSIIGGDAFMSAKGELVKVQSPVTEESIIAAALESVDRINLSKNKMNPELFTDRKKEHVLILLERAMKSPGWKYTNTSSSASESRVIV